MSLAKLDAACGNAMQLQLAGQLDLAEQLYRAVLQARPQHAVANHCIGMLQVQKRRIDDGLPHLLTALEENPSTAEYWLGYLEALLLAGRTQEAAATLALGRQHGLHGEAVDEFAARLAAAAPGAAAKSAPTTKTARVAPKKVSSGSGRRAKREESILMRKWENELLALVQDHQFPAALELARRLTERFPLRGLGWKALGALLSNEETAEESLAAMETAVRLMPGDAEAHVNLGLSLAKRQRYEEAIAFYHKALEITPGFAAAYYRLGMTYEWQGRFAEAEASLRRGIELRTSHCAGDDEMGMSNLLFLVSHNPAVSAESLFAEHRRYGEYFESRLRNIWPRHANDRDPERRLKVGFVSGDFYQHALPSFFEPILARWKDSPGMELHAFYNNSKEDDMTERLRSCFKEWHSVGFLSDIQLTKLIVAEKIDILFDLSGHTGNNRLPALARKPAPIQVSWLGYPGTTGLQAMDYYLADRHFLPPGEFTDQFTEKLIYLPAGAPFRPHPTAPPISESPALKNGFMTFGSFNRIGKINAPTLQLWAALLRRIPQARLFMGGVTINATLQRLIDQLAEAGVDGSRLIFGARSRMNEYLGMHSQVDICLDTQPYSGGTTSYHAFWMGVPTLTIAGPTPASRQGAAIMGQLGLDGFIAKDSADFLDRGAYWAAHAADLAALRPQMRSRWEQSPDRLPQTVALVVEGALRRMWRRWCAGLPAASFEADAADPRPTVQP